MKMPWQGFCYQYIETGWFNHDTRPKTAKAMRVFWERCPAPYLLRIPNVIVFAQGGVLGEVMPGVPEGDQLIYLSEKLERLPQEEINSVVAHEFAHAILGHGTIEGTRAQGKRHKDYGKNGLEVAADSLIKRWGYKASYECNR